MIEAESRAIEHYNAIIEAASPFGWSALTPEMIGMTTFGKSGKAPDLYQFFGITAHPTALSSCSSTLCE